MNQIDFQQVVQSTMNDLLQSYCIHINIAYICDPMQLICNIKLMKWNVASAASLLTWTLTVLLRLFHYCGAIMFCAVAAAAIIGRQLHTLHTRNDSGGIYGAQARHPYLCPLFYPFLSLALFFFLYLLSFSFYYEIYTASYTSAYAERNACAAE